MKKTKNRKYAVKVFEAQWDEQHDTSVKPFFEQLKRNTPIHDALFKYKVFQNAEGLKKNLREYDKGAGNMQKIAYFACHGKDAAICAIDDISRAKLKNIIADLTSYEGMFFGACDFANRNTAEYLLNNSPHLKWVAGYSHRTPWLEGTICDLLFFKFLLSGIFGCLNKNAKWEAISRPEDAATNLYLCYTMAVDLKFSLYYRTKSGIRSTLEDSLRYAEEQLNKLDKLGFTNQSIIDKTY